MASERRPRGPFKKVTDEQLLAIFEEIDADLARQNVPFTARPLKAFIALSQRLGGGLRLVTPGYCPPPPEEGDHAVLLLHEWCNTRYGEKQNVDWSVGAFMFALRGDVWKATLPRFYGRVEIYGDKAKRNDPVLGTRAKSARYNALDAVVGMTDAMRASLTPAEVNGILFAFMHALTAFMALGRARSNALVHAATSDLASAVTHLTGTPRHVGQSRWSSLQAAEKLLKAGIESSGNSYKKTHNLSELALAAASVGLPQMPLGLITDLQVDAGLRYEDDTSTPQQAITAHDAALSVAQVVGEFLPISRVPQAPPSP